MESSRRECKSTTRLESWLQENEDYVDWKLFESPWDHMQLRHNRFREKQIQAIVNAGKPAGKFTSRRSLILLQV